MKKKNHLAKSIRGMSWRLPRGAQGKKQTGLIHYSFFPTFHS